MQRNSSFFFSQKWVSMALFLVVASTIYIGQSTFFNDVERSYAAALTSTNVQPASLIKSVTSTATVSFTTATTITTDGKIKVTFGSGFDLTSVSTSDGTCSSMDGIFSTAVSGQAVTITRSFGSSQDGAETCTIANVKNSASTGSTGTYIIQTLSGADVELDVDSAVTADTIANPDTLTSTNVQPAILTKSTTGTATISFTTITTVSSTDKIKVTFGAGYVLTSVGLGDGTCSTMDGSFSTAVSGQVVTITRSFGTNQTAAAETCTIANVTNSGSTGTTGTYTIRTTNSSDIALQEDTAVAADTIANPDTLTSTNVQPAILTKSTTGTATISFTTITTVSSTDKIKVTFGAGYVLTSVGIGDGTCSTMDGSFSTAVSGQVVTITRSFGTNQTAAAETCTIANVTNSGSTGTTGTYTIRTTNSSDIALQEDTAVAADTIANPDALTSTNVAPAVLGAGRVSLVTVTFTTAAAVANNSKIKVTFPAGFDVSGVNSAACSTMDGGFSASVSGQGVTITRNGFGSSESAAAESCTIDASTGDTIRNPSATGSTGTYSIQILNSSDIALQEDTAVAADTITASLTSTNVQPASLVAGASGNVTVSFTTTDAVKDNGKVKITFPSGFTISSGGATAVSSGTTFTAVTVAGQVVTLSGSGGGAVNEWAASTAATIVITNIKNPTVSGSAGTYTIQTTNSSSTVLNAEDAVAADTITAGALTSTNVEPSSLAASASGNVTVTFTTANTLPLDGKIKVTFGAGFNVASASGGTCSTMDGSFATAVSGQVVTITRSAGTAQTAAAESCTLSNITNPSSAGSTGTYTITTTNTSDASIDTDTAVTANTITAVGALSSTNVAPATLVAGASGTATVTFTTANAIAATGKIKVTFGSGFNVSGASGGTCSTMDGSFATAVSGQVVTITRSAGSSQTAAAESCTIGSIVNPQVSGSTGTYTIQTTDSANTAVDQDTAVAADTITAGALTVTNVEPASLVASASGNATITFTMANPLPANGKVKVTFGAGFNVASASGGTCSTMDGGFSTAVAAQVVTITRNNTGTSEAAGAQSCTLSTIINSASTGTTGTYTILTTNTSDVSIDTDTAVAADTIISGSVGAITGVTIAVNHPYINAGAIYTFTFTTATALEGTDKIKFTFPSGYNIGSARSGTCTAMDGSVSTNASGTLTVVLQRAAGSSFAAGQKICTVSGIVNPSTIGVTGTFSIQTTNNADAVRDQNTSVAGISISAASTSTGSGGSAGVTYDKPAAIHAAPEAPAPTVSKPLPTLTPEPLPTPSVKKTDAPEEKTVQEPVEVPVKETPTGAHTGRELKQEARTIQKEISSLKFDYRKNLEEAESAAEKRKVTRAYRLELHRLSEERKEVQKNIREEAKEEKKAAAKPVPVQKKKEEIKEEPKRIDHKAAKIEKKEEQEKLTKPEMEAAPEAEIKVQEKAMEDKKPEKKTITKPKQEEKSEEKVPEKMTVSEPKVIRIQPPSSKEAKAVRSRLQSLIRVRR